MRVEFHFHLSDKFDFLCIAMALAFSNPEFEFEFELEIAWRPPFCLQLCCGVLNPRCHVSQKGMATRVFQSGTGKNEIRMSHRMEEDAGWNCGKLPFATTTNSARRVHLSSSSRGAHVVACATWAQEKRKRNVYKLLHMLLHRVGGRGGGAGNEHVPQTNVAPFICCTINNIQLQLQLPRPPATACCTPNYSNDSLHLQRIALLPPVGTFCLPLATCHLPQCQAKLQSTLAWACE